MIPCARIDSASAAVDSWSKRLRGCFGLGWICSRGTCASSEEPAPPIRTSSPRPRPRRSGTVDKLHRHLPVGLRAGGARVVGDYRLAVTRLFCDSNRARHTRSKQQVPEVFLELSGDVRGE